MNTLRSSALTLSLLVITSSTLTGQVARPKKSSARTASIEGDAYLMMESGDVKKGSGLTIDLLGDSQAFRDELATKCRDYARVDSGPSGLSAREAVARKAMTAHLGAGGEPEYQAWEALSTEQLKVMAMTIGTIDITLQGASVRRADTGMNAHYSFTNVKPGSYVVFGAWTIGDHHYHWWAPVVLKAGDHGHQDLNNSVLTHSSPYCGLQ